MQTRLGRRRIQALLGVSVVICLSAWLFASSPVFGATRNARPHTGKILVVYDVSTVAQVGSSTSVPPGGTGFATATCPKPSRFEQLVLVGGGWKVTGGTIGAALFSVVTSAAKNADTWYIGVANPKLAPDSVTVEARAMCEYLKYTYVSD